VVFIVFPFQPMIHLLDCVRDNWARTVSPNKQVKIYVGAPASATAAGSGYLDVASLANVIQRTRQQYSSFGGVMLWDVSQAYENNRFDAAIKPVLTNGEIVKSTPIQTDSTSPGCCAGVTAWSPTTVYTKGSHVTYGGQLWTNLWWSHNNVPGGGLPIRIRILIILVGKSGVWTNESTC